MALLVLLPWLAFVSGMHAADGAPRLVVAAPSHDFGRVRQGDVLTHRFTLRNDGDQVLHIESVSPACGCTTAGDWPRTLAPGETGELPFTLDTTRFTGAITKTVAVQTDDPAHREVILEMKAQIWTPVSVRHPVLIFPAVSDPAQPATRSTTLRAEVPEPLQLSELRSTNPAFRAELKEVVPGKEYELVAHTVPPLPDGTQTGHLVMKTSLASAPEVSVQAVVTVLPAVQIAPAEIPFTTKRLAAVEKRYAVVLNHRGGDLKVTDVVTDAPGVAVSMQPSADGRQVTISLTFPAGFEIAPERSYALRGKTTHAGTPRFEIPIVYAGGR